MTQINAYLTFNGNCREAMNYYKECLGGELTLQTVDGTPMADKMPPQMRQHILHSTLQKDSLMIMASDMAREKLAGGNRVSLMLNCSSDDEINGYFNKLSDGGQIIDPLAEMFWGAKFGTIEDKFGINWLLHYNKNQQ
ncbi:VOC family protein [Polluticoccus soli]|uniref:VOC family protein n=1 Tax=Polluticoccus soli TaxID=3034150 RepID=UPI0023E0D2D9|nr:VOC family protein [Flavipsychrobacter sp. JY13-12]